jgi:hypothetical protein
MKTLGTCLAALAVFGVGCSSGADAPKGTVFGNVIVEIFKDQYTGFLASFFDATPPPMMPLDARQTQGGCKLLVPLAASCAPACAVGSVCVGPNQCAPQPAPVGVGVLHVEGLGATPLDLEPTSATVLSYQAVPTLPYPACAEGDDVTARATAFMLGAKCVSDLAVTSAVPIPVVSGQAMHLAWTAPGRTGISRIQIELEISHHGGYKGQIDCDVPDTGSFDVPAPLVTGLVALGRSGYPTVKIARVSKNAAPTEPGVALAVSSRVELEVDTGVISCGAPASPDCPAGKTCQVDFTCQ